MYIVYHIHKHKYTHTQYTHSIRNTETTYIYDIHVIYTNFLPSTYDRDVLYVSPTVLVPWQ